MELQEVIGRRRTIRFFLPFRPVERAKIQKMLEAARHASCGGNVMNVRGVVLMRDQTPKEIMDTIKLPLGYQQMHTAPAFIMWYSDYEAFDGRFWIDQTIELAKTRRMGPDLEATLDELENKLLPVFESMDPKLVGNSPAAGMDAGQSIAQATLMAYEQGLGTCLMGGPLLNKLSKKLEAPDSWVPLVLQAVGYPAESWEAGGQTHKPELGELFFEGKVGNPFLPDPEVEEELKQSKMIDELAPLPWREAELQYLVRGLGLDNKMLDVEMFGAAEDMMGSSDED